MKTAAVVIAAGALMGTAGVAVIQPKPAGVAFIFLLAFAAAVLIAALFTRKKTATNASD